MRMNLLDVASLYEASLVLENRYSKAIKINYKLIIELLNEYRGWKDDVTNLAMVSIDPSSEGQSKFLNMLTKNGFELDITHYRLTTVSTVQQTNPKISSLSSKISYLLGLLADKRSLELNVVSHSFDLHPAMMDLSNRFPGQIQLAYFGTLLDYRWNNYFSTIPFLNLEHNAEVIGMGKDFVGQETPTTTFGRFKPL